MNPMDEIVQQAMGGQVPQVTPGASGAGQVGVPGGAPGGGDPYQMAGAQGAGPDVGAVMREAEQVLQGGRPGGFDAGYDHAPEMEAEDWDADYQGHLDEAAEHLGFDIPDDVDDQSFDQQVAWIANQAVQDAVAQTVAPLQAQLAQAEARNQALANATHASAVIAQHAGVPDAAPQLQTIFSQAAMIGIDPVVAMQTPWFAELVMGYVNGHRVQTVADGLRQGSQPLPVAAHVGGGLPAESERPEYAAWDRAMSRQFKDVLGMDLSSMAERGR
jgi:hypothetical protein